MNSKKETKEMRVIREAFEYAIRNTEWREHYFELSDGTEFSVVHNIPDIFGISIDCAFDNWLARTDDYTAQSLVDYIMSMHHMHGNYAMTKEMWDSMNA